MIVDFVCNTRLPLKEISQTADEIARVFNIPSKRYGPADTTEAISNPQPLPYYVESFLPDFASLRFRFLLFGSSTGRGKSQRPCSANWDTTSGTIASSRAGMDSYSSAWQPEVTYEYVVQGRKYTGSTIAIGGLGNRGDSQSASKALTEYATGKSVRVYYNPSDPADALLLPGVHATTFVDLVMSLAMTTVAL